MKWWGWLLGLALSVGLLGSGWLLARSQGQRQAQRFADSAAVADHHRDSVTAVLRDSIVRTAARASIDSTRAATLEVQKRTDSTASAAAGAEVKVATTKLEQAQSAIDSFPIYRDELVPALRHEAGSLQVELARSDSGRFAWHDAYQHEIVLNGALVGMLHEDTLAMAAKDKALAAQSAVPVVALSFWPKVGRAAETAAIGVVTVEACRNHLLSVGCFAGVVVTGRRLIK